MVVAPPCGDHPPLGARPEGVRRGPRVQFRPMPLTPLPDLILYSRPGCHLCEEARRDVIGLLEARRRAGLTTPVLIERDIETDPGWERAFFASIPVIELGDRRLELATSASKMRRLLTDVLDA